MTKLEDVIEQVLSSSGHETGLSRNELRALFERIKKTTINLLIVGSTGAGKSSTINALFSMDTAKVGTGVDPETMGIHRYELDNLILWDTPGLGDSPEKDEQHLKVINKKLCEVDEDGNLLIDMVLLIVDGSSRDMGSVYTLLEKAILPRLNNDSKRLLIAINQTDIAMKGMHWNDVKNEPDEELIEFMEKKVDSIKNRVYEATKVNVSPIYYAAGNKEVGGNKAPYNLQKLLSLIMGSVTLKKRMIFINNINQDKGNFKHNDDADSYDENINDSVVGSIYENIKDFFAGALGSIGKAVNNVITDPRTTNLIINALSRMFR